jgi:rRNA maturation endonuclease Nob1
VKTGISAKLSLRFTGGKMASTTNPAKDSQIICENYEETTDNEQIDFYTTCKRCSKDFEIFLNNCPFCGLNIWEE